MAYETSRREFLKTAGTATGLAAVGGLGSVVADAYKASAETYPSLEFEEVFGANVISPKVRSNADGSYTVGPIQHQGEEIKVTYNPSAEKGKGRVNVEVIKKDRNLVQVLEGDKFTLISVRDYTGPKAYTERAINETLPKPLREGYWSEWQRLFGIINNYLSGNPNKK